MAALDGGHDYWHAVYVRWELGLLDLLGFGLDLSVCAVTGVNDDLIYVSPRTGRAVSASAGEPYRMRLRTLPQFVIGGNTKGAVDVLAGLKLTGFFLERHLFASEKSGIPPARERFVARLARAHTKSGVINGA